MQIEIWSDVVCPWCYLGKRQFDTALGGFTHRDDVEVIYRSFELDPHAPRDTTTDTIELLADKYGMTSDQARDAQRQMTQRAAALGLTFDLDGLRSGNTRDAHRLLALARRRRLDSELSERLHRAYFVERGSVFDAESLTRLAVETGLDPVEVSTLLAGDEYDDDVLADEATARSLGATGVPFVVIDRRFGLAGAQPPEVIADLLDQAWAQQAAT